MREENFNTLVVIKFSAKISGGNLLLQQFIAERYEDKIIKTVSILPTEGNKIKKTTQFIINILRLLVCTVILKPKKTIIVYSDPILSFLDLIIPKNQIIRLIQSYDEELYTGNPALSRQLQKFLTAYIIFAFKYGSSTKFVFTNVLLKHIRQYDCSVQKQKIPLSLPKLRVEFKKGRHISCIMSNPVLKNLDLLKEIARDFPSKNFEILTGKTQNFGLPDNVKIRHFESREDLICSLQSAACHLSVSEKESIGLPVFEAMAVNVPSIFLLNEGNRQFNAPDLLSFEIYDKELMKRFFIDLESDFFKAALLQAQKRVIDQHFNLRLEYV